MATSHAPQFSLGMIVVPDDTLTSPTRNALPFIWAWGIPIVILISVNFLQGTIPISALVVITSAAFTWMGLGCVLNARRCKRRHCYYSGPVFLLGAVGVLLVGFQVIDFGQDGLIYVVSITAGLAILSYATELIQGKYVQ